MTITRQHIKRATWLALAALGVFALATTVASAATVLFPQQGGTGIATTSAGSVGKCLQVSSSSPLTFTFGTCAGGSGATTTITAGGTATGPSLTFATTGPAIVTVVCTGSTCTFTNSSSSLNLDTASTYMFADFRSSSTLTVSTFNGVSGTVTGVGSLLGSAPVSVNVATGTVTVSCPTCMTTSTNLSKNNFATGSVSQWTNDAGYQKKEPIPWVIENPTASEDDAVIIVNDTSTVTNFYSVNKSGGDTVTFNWIWCASRTAASSTCAHLFSTNATSTATTTPDTFPATRAFASSSINAGSVLRFITSAASSSQLTQTIWLTTP